MVLLLLQVGGEGVGTTNVGTTDGRGTGIEAAGGHAVQTRRARGRATDGAVGALAESDQTSIAFVADVTYARHSVICVGTLAHLVVEGVAAAGPSCATTDTARGARAADCTSLLEPRTAIKVAREMGCRDSGIGGRLSARPRGGDALEARKARNTIGALGFQRGG